MKTEQFVTRLLQTPKMFFSSYQSKQEKALSRSHVDRGGKQEHS